jgi:histidine triad (HIT) family protein
MENCIFCKIVKKEIKADIVYEDEKVLAFRDISPKAPIHVLVIPKTHIDGFVYLKDEHSSDMNSVLEAINKVVEILKIKEKGFRIIVNSGKDGGQEVEHLHFHILGGKPLNFPIL